MASNVRGKSEAAMYKTETPFVYFTWFQCFVFHLYKGVRAGGGIGDEIEPPDGDDKEVNRIFSY